MFCSNCGVTLTVGAKFCSNCGTPVAPPSGQAKKPGIKVDQHVETNEGQVVGLSAGQGAVDAGLNADIKQDFGVIKDGGAAVGAILGATGPVNVGGTHHYEEVNQGPKYDVKVSGSQGVIIGDHGRININNGISPADLAGIFTPILQAAQNASPGQRQQAAQTAEQLQAEVAKGAQADDKTMAGLIESLVGMVPGAVGAVVSAFGSPLLAGIAGPVTSYVLSRLGLKL